MQLTCQTQKTQDIPTIFADTMNSFASYLLTFLPIPEPSLSLLLNLFKPHQFKKNDFYARAGEHAKKIGFVQDGIMRAYYQNDKGEEFNKLFFTNPAIVGPYSALITGEINRINIQWLTDGALLEANFQDIIDLYAEHRTIESLNRKIAEDFFVKKEKREMSLVMNDASERYALFQKEYPTLQNQIAQYHIASYLGVTPTQLSRIRGKKG